MLAVAAAPILLTAVSAQAQESGSAVLQEVIVTANRRDQALTKVPASVAVFTQDLGKPPEVLRFDSAGRAPAEAKIRLEDSSLSKDEIQSLSNAVPPGYRQSKTCKGLRLSDDSSDAAHIYWDHEARRFDTWTQ